MGRLNFKHLYYFYVVAKEGSIKIASEKLHVSAATVSDQLRLLEDYLKAKLFERRNRRLFLTEKGKVTLSYSEKVFKLEHELISKLSTKDFDSSKQVRIGITPYMSHYFLYERILPIFKQRALAIHLKEDTRQRLLLELEDGEIDLIITNHGEGVSHNLSSWEIGINKTFVVAHKKYARFKKNFPKSLNNLPFFHYTLSSVFRHTIDLYFSQQQIYPKIIGEADDLDLFETVTGSGLAFTIVPEVTKNRMCRREEIVVLGELKELQSCVWAMVNEARGNRISKLVKKFLKNQ